ncbi:hypothetical protein [Paraburkholderia sp. BL9I2N2]|uniref:hypothetical protein n=1 Tax=Paraburkholderia sp. BL9I2N2 TaxID=1938809 RepID=UPI0010470E6B|nr:hypothetical protein [Paraburkholderia sp. BL9I2N2]TCK97114.1 hypothetical protein B0G74_3816 [Paraburkholderia sp. BL9I2N2]
MPSNRNLWILPAVFNAFIGKEIDYYPRQQGETVSPDTYLPKIASELQRLDDLGVIDGSYLDRAKDSLKEVKDLTEYQDQKAARLLTIVAFLTAAAGALFSKLLDAYPLHQTFLLSPIKGAFLGGVYSLFGLFLLCVACGALIIFHATQTRFVWPKEKSEEATYDSANSFLFYRSILRTDPVGWARSFVDSTSKKEDGNRLTSSYYKNYVSEAYLVAAKLGDKLRYLQPGQKLLRLAIKLLVIWLLLLFVVALWIPKVTNSPVTQVSVVPLCYPCAPPFAALGAVAPATDVNDSGDMKRHVSGSTLPAAAESSPAASDTVRTIKQSGRGCTHDHASCSMRRRQHAVGH